MRHLTSLAFVLAFIACGKDKGSGGGNATGGGDSSGFDKLKVDIAGKPIAMTKAFIKRIPVDGRFQVFLTDGNGNCNELIDNSFDHMSPNAVLFDVGPRIQPDNKTFKTEVTYLYSGPDDATFKPGSSLTIKGNADKGSTADITIDADITVTGSKRPGAIAIHGSFTAEGCGERAVTNHDGEPKAAHPSKATITVAGKTLPIVGAIFKDKSPEPKDGVQEQRNLYLTTGPQDCSGTWPWAAFELERTWRAWELGGEYVNPKRNNGGMIDKDGQPETKGITVTVGAKGDSPDGPTFQVELGGSGTVGGVAIALKGTVEVIDCPEPK